MPGGVPLLMVQFLEWVASRQRTYAETMDAWRTSCPRLSVWEDALMDGLVQIDHHQVSITEAGKSVLNNHR